MTLPQIEIQLVVSLVAIACAIPGVFLVLRKMSLISDAISHSILPGIAIGFLLTHDIASPLLIILAALSGLLTVFLVEMIQKTGLVKEDTAIGLVFPVLFSIGVVLIAQKANDVHLDIDAVILGKPAFIPVYRMVLFDMDLGPKILWVIGSILLLVLALLFAFFKELKITTFDVGLATSLGFSPILVHYGLMTVSSITIVGSFDAVGAILVVALMIAPAATAYLLTTDLKKMLFLSCGIGVFSAITGYWLAHYLNASIAGSMTTVLGIVFLLVFLAAPSKGTIAVYIRKRQQKKEVALLILLLHINNHKEENERHVKHLQEHINWQGSTAKAVLLLASSNNLIETKKEIIHLTKKGQKFTEQAMHYIVTNKKDKIEHMKEDFLLFRG